MNLSINKILSLIPIGVVLSLTLTLLSGCLAPKQVTKVNFEYNSRVEGWLIENNVPAIGIGIIEHGKIKQAEVFGNLKDGVRAPQNTLFNIASITKPIVAVLTLKLVAAGEWQLDEPLDKYWIDPDVASDPLHSKLTTRLILLHKSGFPNWRWNQPGQKLVFEYAPGSHYQYSGEGFDYLKRALEHKFNKTIDKLLDSVLFKPLKMNNTSYWENDLDTARFAAWHDRQGNLYSGSINTTVSAADDLITTVEDMCKFGVFVMNGAGLPEDLFNDMIYPQVSLGGGYSRGLGWGVISMLPHQEYAIEHAGSDRGVRTRVIFLPKSKRGLVMFTNGDNGIRVYEKVIIESLDIGEEITKRLK